MVPRSDRKHWPEMAAPTHFANDGPATIAGDVNGDLINIQGVGNKTK